MGDEEKSVDLEYVARAKDVVREYVDKRYKLVGAGWTKYEVLVVWCSWSDTKWTVGLKTSKFDDMYYQVSYDETETDRLTLRIFEQFNLLVIA